MDYIDKQTGDYEFKESSFDDRAALHAGDFKGSYSQYPSTTAAYGARRNKSNRAVMKNDSSRMGNVLGRFIKGRRKASNQNTVSEFGRRVLARYPGMGEFMSRALFRSPDREKDIQWTVDEIQQLTASNSYSTSNSGGSILSGVDSSRWPIAPTYDYLLTLDMAVGDMINEITRIQSLGGLGDKEEQNMNRRVYMPDSRPVWYHASVALGAMDSNGNVVTTGQALGSDRVYEPGMDAPLLPKFHGKQPFIRPKTKYELACDAAQLLSYPHMNDITSLSQGLFRVNFTSGQRKLTTNGMGGRMIARNHWINSFEGDRRSATTKAGLNDHPGSVLAAQPTNLNSYPQNRFDRESGSLGYQLPSGIAYSEAEQTVGLQSGGAMSELYTVKDGNRTAPSKNDSGVPVDAIALGDDDYRRAASRYAGSHAVSFVPVFAEIAKSVGIGDGLQNLHEDVKTVFADMWTSSRLQTYRPTNHFQIAQRSGCPGHSSKIFTDRRGRTVPQFIQTAKGKIRNPEAINGTCAPLVKSRKAASFKGRAMVFGMNDGLPGMAYKARSRRKRSSSRKRTSSRKRSTSRARSSSRKRSTSRARSTSRKKSTARSRSRSSSRKRSTSRARSTSRKKSTARSRSRSFSRKKKSTARSRSRSSSRKKKSTARSRSRSSSRKHSSRKQTSRSRSRSRKYSAKARSRKRSTKKKSSKKKARATGRKKNGRKVYRGAQGALFVRRGRKQTRVYV